MNKMKTPRNTSSWWEFFTSQELNEEYNLQIIEKTGLSWNYMNNVIWIPLYVQRVEHGEISLNQFYTSLKSIVRYQDWWLFRELPEDVKRSLFQKPSIKVK